ncbi:DNA mismatch repair endonuclease MutL [Pseudocolwellia sp. HL-MZ19]|uniref:DNA mismatch repair endonuclease MutL n=1 Tax=Pseudocolwellia sp. HL-MZ19 TaxID=3400846 RepID=UPI003CF088FA
MSIEILPAQLANQIAAGEVVERPASVIKELVENSLDAGATNIKIQIEKGGAKRIKISDNGSGISKAELALALSRHATSKIKTLNDLEGISSLGFRGEALASISSVSRLTLTSKPADQESAWQASAEGRDMAVDIKPAAHPTGTTIDVQDLFFNTPARRKFLRTDKTEFTHIEEVIKRIALACLDVTFVLMHNDKIIRQYRAANTKAQCAKRVAQICGQKFIEHAIEVECQHDDLHFSGWLAKPSFARNQNDLCYSYVNGRMMRDKLINHAIRQAYSDLLPLDTYPAFVLFLTLNHRDVDVNVHPAKHEVRFHQGRYIHDFIFSVCQRALLDEGVVQASLNELHDQGTYESVNREPPYQANSLHQAHEAEPVEQEAQSYIKPLSYVGEASRAQYSPSYSGNQSARLSTKQQNAYYQLMSNDAEQKGGELSGSAASNHSTGNVHSDDSQLNNNSHSEENNSSTGILGNVIDNLSVLHIVQDTHALVLFNKELRLLSLAKLEANVCIGELQSKWDAGFVSQPLLLPVKIELDKIQLQFLELNQSYFERLGIIVNIVNNNAIQIRQFPALLRNKDVTNSFSHIIDAVFKRNEANELTEADWLLAVISLLQPSSYTTEITHTLFNRLKNSQSNVIDQLLLLNSTPVDLTSELEQLM